MLRRAFQTVKVAIKGRGPYCLWTVIWRPSLLLAGLTATKLGGSLQLSVCFPKSSALMMTCILLQAAVEYFRLMLPPWDAKGSCKGWVKLSVRP